MTYVDAALLDLTEWLCQRFQAWTGRTNVWLAFHLTNLSIVVYFTWVGALYWATGLLAVRVFVALFCGGVFFMLTRTLFRMSIEASDAQAYQRVAKGLRNPRRVRDAQLRIAFLTLSILLVMPLWFAYTILRVQFILYAEALAVLTTAVLYLLACDPLPPCEGKVWKWLRGPAPARRAESQVSEERDRAIANCRLVPAAGRRRDRPVWDVEGPPVRSELLTSAQFEPAALPRSPSLAVQ